MDHEKYPNYFLAVMVLYAIVLVVGLAYFILPSMGFAGAYSDFYIISFLFFLPLILFAIYGMGPGISLEEGRNPQDFNNGPRRG